MSEEVKMKLEEEARSLGVRLARAQENREVAEAQYRQAESAAAGARTLLRRAEEMLELARAQEQQALDDLQASAMRRHVLIAKEDM